MNIENKYQENYILLAGLRAYVENGTMLSSVNHWRDCYQNFKELEVQEHREELLKSSPQFMRSEFLVAFVKEDFPEIEDEIPENILAIAMSIIEAHEGKETAEITKQFLIEYAINIAKSSKEDWLSFIGIKDSISNKEEEFINNLRFLFDFNK